MDAAAPALPPENVTRAPRQTHMEIMNPVTGDVWLLQDPITAAEFAAIRLEAPFVKTGLGTGAMDAAWFTRSPGAAADGPVETRWLGGHSFARIARVRHFGGLARGEAATLIRVEKHHVLQFVAGRTVTLARLPDGRLYVEQTEPTPGRPIGVPPDWQLVAVPLTTDWQIELPCPTSVYFFTSLRSFAGPIPEAQLPAGGPTSGRS